MALLVALVAGLLVVAESQASEKADRSNPQGFLSQYDKFITPRFNGGHNALSQESLTSTQDFDLPKIADNGHNTPITLSAIGIGLLSLVTMLGVGMRRALQPATASSDMSMNMAPGLGDNFMEMQSQGSVSSRRVGLGQPSSQNSNKTIMAAAETKADLEALAKELNPIVGFYDPLGLSDQNFWGKSESETIAWLRHAEIKHGRVAMAAFSGYTVQANGYHWPWAMTMDGQSFDMSSMSPPEQWDAIPLNAKLQIIGFVGFLEFYDEIAGTHYMKGGVPGKYPSFKEVGADKFLPVDLYDPAGFNGSMSKEKSTRLLKVEINNGRAAMLGIFAFLSASKIPGSVPLLEGIIKPYAGQVMSPFEGNYDLFA
jgi:hypothetical protein